MVQVELKFAQPPVQTVLVAQKIGVRAALDHGAFLDDDDAVRLAHGRQPVRDDKARAPAHQHVERLLDDALALGVERAGGLVENQDDRVLQDGPGNGDALALPAGELDAALADHRAVALGNPAMKSCALACRAAASISAWLAPGLP